MIGDKYTKFNGGGVSRSTATLMKTGQLISYRAGDDGDLEAGRDVNFFTLAENNPFGNTNRFTDELGGSTYANNIVIDWSTYNGTTVLGWDRRTNGGNADVNKTWNNAIDESLLHSTGGVTSGWRLPNYIEYSSIINFSLTSSLNYAPFNLSIGYTYWSNTSLNSGNTLAYFLFPLEFLGYKIGAAAKNNDNGYRWLAVRTFTVTGTTLS